MLVMVKSEDEELTTEFNNMGAIGICEMSNIFEVMEAKSKLQLLAITYTISTPESQTITTPCIPLALLNLEFANYRSWD